MALSWLCPAPLAAGWSLRLVVPDCADTGCLRLVQICCFSAVCQLSRPRLPQVLWLGLVLLAAARWLLAVSLPLLWLVVAVLLKLVVPDFADTERLRVK